MTNIVENVIFIRYLRQQVAHELFRFTSPSFLQRKAFFYIHIYTRFTICHVYVLCGNFHFIFLHLTALYFVFLSSFTKLHFSLFTPLSISFYLLVVFLFLTRQMYIFQLELHQLLYRLLYTYIYYFYLQPLAMQWNVETIISLYTLLFLFDSKFTFHT